MGAHRTSGEIRWVRRPNLVRILVLVLLLAACTDTEPPQASKSGSRPTAPPEGAAAVESREAPKDPLSGGLLEDRGDPCATHRYVLAPGTTTTLAFEIALPAPAPEIAPDELRILDNHWEEIGAGASLGYCRIESSDVSHSRWVVDGRDFLADRRERAREPVTTTFGDVLIVWGHDGYGVISQTRRFRRPQEVGELSENQLAEQLGGSTTIEYVDPDSRESYTWIAEHRTSEPTAHVLVIELTVDTPPNATDTAPKSLTVATESQQWALALQYSDFRDVFLVTGPALKLACLAR